VSSELTRVGQSILQVFGEYYTRHRARATLILYDIQTRNQMQQAHKNSEAEIERVKAEQTRAAAEVQRVFDTTSRTAQLVAQVRFVNGVTFTESHLVPLNILGSCASSLCHFPTIIVSHGRADNKSN
jgi:hypothetical protein